MSNDQATGSSTTCTTTATAHRADQRHSPDGHPHPEHGEQSRGAVADGRTLVPADHSPNGERQTGSDPGRTLQRDDGPGGADRARADGGADLGHPSRLGHPYAAELCAHCWL